MKAKILIVAAAIGVSVTGCSSPPANKPKPTATAPQCSTTCHSSLARQSAAAAAAASELAASDAAAQAKASKAATLEAAKLATRYKAAGYHRRATTYGDVVYLKVQRPHIAAFLDGKQAQLMVGYQISVAPGNTDVDFDVAQFMDATGNQDSTNYFAHSASGAINTACDETPTLGQIAARKGWITEFGTAAEQTSFEIPARSAPVTGCVALEQNFASPVPALYFVADDSNATDPTYRPTPVERVVAATQVHLPERPQPPPPPAITYKITGNGSQSGVVTYIEGGSSIEQATNASLPWTKRVSPNSDYYSVSAQDADGTSITCEILDTDGTVLDKHTSTGLYAIASCQSSN